ncbi:hypothetical protein [Pseudomonas sp. Colony2]|uniref:hypothetical protein n=1 Tax=Pseudomonas sp. Colony2 TaxID=2861799 RepID=UPI001C5F4EC1|nr:hypothetical protein [Pseudomonas sp. Colony2]
MKIENLSYGLSVKYHAYPVVAVGKMDISGNSQPLRQIDEITHPRQSFISVLLRAPLILQLTKLKNMRR